MSLKRLALIVGSGFSAELGLPTTKGLSTEFLKTPADTVLPPPLENGITQVLKTFWRDVFAYDCGPSPPSLEDHFTVLDLSANTGHHLGPRYPPKKLRAIRRFSIHRIFQILDMRLGDNAPLFEFLRALSDKFDLSVVTLNWDIAVERVLQNGKGVTYQITIGKLDDTFEKQEGIPLLKMHGSSNWLYCDSCRRLYAGAEKTGLHRQAFLDQDDFHLFADVFPELNSEHQLRNTRNCSHCGNRLAGRLATFSYRKAFSIHQFQTIWERAHEALSSADIWLFVGYSMPEADFEFRHLLKSAQLARDNNSSWSCKVVLKDDGSTKKRYLTFFGIDPSAVFQRGFSTWIADFGNEFLLSASAT